ncbi:MAG: FAD-binding protein, partial [Chlamydiia bacterium]|nr:FAD-binding protein [Chlamydiia bacterium]
HHRDQTGSVILDAMLQKLQSYPDVQILGDHTAVDLITLSHHSTRLTDIYRKPTCVGAYLLNNETHEVETWLAKETVLATGGLGEVYLHTTNPSGARGDGLAMAYRAGVRIMNMEFVQFHPTSLYVPNERRFLISETLRGEGAELLTFEGESFMHRYDNRGTLAPRDIVARGIYTEMLRTQSDHVWLDISRREPDWIRQRFPKIYQHCLERHIDMTSEPLPVVPAAHYCCGGITVDRAGQTSMQRLRAVGEVACTGVHGANRLASASLLEGLVWGRTCAEDISQQIKRFAYYFPTVNDWVMAKEDVDPALLHQDWMAIKQTMWNYVGLVRNRRRLRRASTMLAELKSEIDTFYEEAKLTPEVLGLRNGVPTAQLVTQGASRNKTSLGCHFRED